jgi:predicted XRE-type DNA-binding protein
MNNFYIYIYLDSRNLGKYSYKNFSFLYKPFYVGKGKSGRYKEISNRNDDFIDIINEIKKLGLKPIIIKLYENLHEKQSFEFETKLINEIGRLDLGTGFLINKTSGGQGNSGLIFSDEHRRKISESNKGKNWFGKHLSEEIKSKMSESRKGRKFSEETRKKISESNKDKHPSEETRKKLSESHIGENNYWFGKNHSEESRKKMSEKTKGENHPNHKLTEYDVIEIKLLLLENNFSQIQIAIIFGVSRQTISDIKYGRIWSHVKVGE